MTTKSNMAVKLAPELRAKLQALGEAKKRSPHWLMCEAIERYVQVEEEVERHKAEALDALARFEATGKHVAHQDVDAWLDSWGSDAEAPAPRPTRASPK